MKVIVLCQDGEPINVTAVPKENDKPYQLEQLRTQVYTTRKSLLTAAYTALNPGKQPEETELPLLLIYVLEIESREMK